MNFDHASAMDRMYRWQSHIYDLTRKPYLLGRDHLLTELCPPPGGSVLELGCGTGRNLIVAAKLYPGRQFFGVDISNVMLDKARDSVRRIAPASDIKLAQGDATRIDSVALFNRSTFDRVFVSYALSMIPPWQDVLSHAYELTAPGGSVHVVDFGDQAGLPRIFARVLRRWLALFSVTPRLDLEDEVARASGATGHAQREFERLHGGYAFYAVIRMGIRS